MKGSIEAATVFWYSREIKTSADGVKKLDRRNRKFESVENAVTFVMEKLSATERGTSIIMTDSRSIYPMDMKSIYTGLEIGNCPCSVSHGICDLRLHALDEFHRAGWRAHLALVDDVSEDVARHFLRPGLVDFRQIVRLAATGPGLKALGPGV